MTYADAWAIIDANCSGCHSMGHGGFVNGKLDMSDKATAYTNLVGVKAMGTKCAASMEVRVVAGSSAMSLLYNKINEAVPVCGARMPNGRPPLSDAHIKTIKNWIDQGALDN